MNLSGKVVKVLRLPTVEYKTKVIIIPAKLYDNGSRVLNVSLYDDRGTVSLSGFSRASLNVTLPDATKQVATFGTSDFDTDNNSASLTIPGSFFSQSGRVICDVTFYGDNGETLSSQDFTIFVYKGQYSDSAVTGDNNYSSLQQLLAEVEQYKKDIEDHLMSISYVENLTDNYMTIDVLAKGYALSSTSGAAYGTVVSSANTVNSATSDYIELPRSPKTSAIYLSYRGASGNRGFSKYTRVMFYDSNKQALTVGDDGSTNPNYSAALTTEAFGASHANGRIAVPSAACYVRFTVNANGSTLSQFMVCGTYQTEYVEGLSGYAFNKPLVGYLTESQVEDTYTPKAALEDYAKKSELSDYAKVSNLEEYVTKDAAKNQFVSFSSVVTTSVNLLNATTDFFVSGKALSIVPESFGETVTPSSNGQYLITSGYVFLPTGNGRKLYPSYRAVSSGNRGCTRFVRIIYYKDDKTPIKTAGSYYSAAALISETFLADNPNGCLDIPNDASYARFTVQCKSSASTDNVELDQYMVCYSEQTAYVPYSDESEYVLSKDIRGYVKDDELESYVTKDDANEFVTKDWISKTSEEMSLTVGKMFLPLAQVSIGTETKIVKSTDARRRVYYLPLPQDYRGLSLTAMNDHGNYICFGSFYSGNIESTVLNFTNKSTAIVLTTVGRNLAPLGAERGKSFFNGDPVTIAPASTDNYLCLAVAINDDLIVDGEEITDTKKIEDIYQKILSTTRIIVEDAGMIHAPFETSGAYYAIQKSEQFLNTEWTPIKTMPMSKTAVNGVNNATFPAGTKVKGLPYSSVKAMSRFIGIDVLLETFITALENKNSILYTYDAREGQAEKNTGILNPVYEKVFTPVFDAGKWVCKVTADNLSKATSVPHKNASCYYGTVCSSLVAYAIGMPTYETTYSWRNPSNHLSRVRDKSCYSLKRGDTMLQLNKSGGGHTSVISDIERDSSGDVKFITVTEASHPVIKKTRYTCNRFTDYVLTNAADPGEVVPTNDVYRFDNLDLNRCADYDAAWLRKSGTDYCMYLDSTFDEVGCVFLDDVEIFDYTYDPSSCLLKIPTASVPASMRNGNYVKCKRVKAGALDTWRSFFAPASSYNHNPLIQLDRGNKSVYRHGGDVVGYGDSIVFTVNASTAKMRIYNANGDPVQSEPFVASTNTNYDPDTKVCVIDAGTLTPGYYTACVVVNKEVTDTETGEKKTVEIDDPDNKRVEFLVYETGEIAIANTLDDTGAIQLSDGKIKGSVSGFSDELTPYYVELCNVNNVVRYTAFVQNNDNQHTFEISVPSIDESNGYIKVHYKCRYGRVVTETYKIYAVDAGVITVEQYKEITGQNYQA